MNKDTYRITARILREDGIEKTVTFRGNFGNMDKILRESFHAIKYKLFKINETRISSNEWDPVKTDEEITQEIKDLAANYKKEQAKLFSGALYGQSTKSKESEENENA